MVLTAPLSARPASPVPRWSAPVPRAPCVNGPLRFSDMTPCVPVISCGIPLPADAVAIPADKERSHIPRHAPGRKCAPALASPRRPRRPS